MGRILSLAIKRKKYYLLGISALFITDIAQVLIPKLLIPKAFDIASGKNPNSEQFIGSLSYYVLIMILFAIIIAAGRYIWRTAMLGSSRVIETELRKTFFERILGLPLSFFREFKTGDLMSRATNDLKMVRTATGMAFVAFLDSFIMLSITLVIALTTYGKLALIGMAFLSVIPLILLGIGTAAMKKFKEVQESYAAITGYVQENLNGIRVIKTLAKEKFAISRFEKLNNDYKHKYRSVIITFGMIFPIISVFIGLSSYMIIRFGGIEMIKGNLTPGNFTALTYFINLMVWPMIGIGYSTTMLMRGRVSIKRIYEILDKQSEKEIEIQDKALQKESSITNDNEFTGLFDKEAVTLSIKNLEWSYPDLSDKKVLSGISFDLKAGETIGILGKTGSGKSTLINLIPRLLKTPTNSIFIDNIDICSLPIARVRELISLVPQETLLFSDTIRNNIAFGAAEIEKCSEEELIEKASISTIEREFSIFPDGWKTVIGEKGTTVSGGQKQRIAISRALMKKAPIIILDDAFASVDTSTEEKILQGISKWRNKESMIMVSHRVSTLKSCDRIIVIDEGKIAESGTHSQLMQKAGIYHEIAIIQQTQAEDIK